MFQVNPRLGKGFTWKSSLISTKDKSNKLKCRLLHFLFGVLRVKLIDLYFVLSFFPRGVLDEILNLIESVSEGFPSYSYTFFIYPSSALI